MGRVVITGREIIEGDVFLRMRCGCIGLRMEWCDTDNDCAQCENNSVEIRHKSSRKIVCFCYMRGIGGPLKGVCDGAHKSVLVL